jgi:hypothetical protein
VFDIAKPNPNTEHSLPNPKVSYQYKQLNVNGLGAIG